MTGPRNSTVHPHRRRGRLLLPFLAAIVLGPLACTSDQPTEPASPATGPLAAATGSHPRPRLHTGSTSFTQVRPRSSVSFSVSSAVSTGAPSVLILADIDGASTTALADTLTAAGFQVSVRPAPEYTWDATDPVLDGFDVVVHLNGSTYDFSLPPVAQRALSSFVSNGGGYIGAQWNGVEFTPDMTDLVLQTYGGAADGPEKNCAACQVTYDAVGGQEGHPVLAGLPGSFTFTADGHDAGPLVSDLSSVVLMQLPSGGPGVVVREFGSGKVVNFSFAPNYPFNELGEPRDPTTLMDEHVKGLYVNAARWLSGSAAGVAQPQTITFDPLPNKTYGDPAFSITATASSDLPVSLSAVGQCSVAGTTVTIDAAGSCTITASQAGNANFQPAEDVVRSFTIAKAAATIAVGTEYTYDGTVKAATITTNPAGLTVVTVTYSQGGLPVGSPDNAGVYQVLATLDNPNYEASPAIGTLTIHPATPVLSWMPASIVAGAPLGAAQLNATARGVGGASLSGSFSYNPSAGTTFSAGTATLAVDFTADSPNYSGGSKSVIIKVLGGLTFSGFFAPVRNMPFVNVATAGSAIPMKFTVGGYSGLQVLSVGSPSSAPVQCDSNAPENSVRMGTLASSGLHSAGYSYTYVWKTNPAWAGTCRKFVLTLSDGSTHEALFRFPPKPSSAAGAVRRILGR